VHAILILRKLAPNLREGLKT